ncbi:MAG TPA: YihY/virulence factor BrkB family protein [Opitutaceae bacterium]
MVGWIKTSIEAGKRWNDDNAFQHAAAVSFYTLFSLAPITIIAVGIAGLFMGRTEAAKEFSAQMAQLVGPDSASLIESTMQATTSHQGSLISAIVGGVILVVGATSVFAQLQQSLNQLWGVRTKPSKSGLLILATKRVISFAMVVVVGFLLLVSLVISTLLTSAVHSFDRRFTVPPAMLQIIDVVAALGVITVLFACLFKLLPDVYLRWREVWQSAFYTSVLFSLGRFLIALYLGHSTVASVYGAAGSLVALLVWVYYSSSILFFGVEYLRAAHMAAGLEIRPKKTAVIVREIYEEKNI